MHPQAADQIILCFYVHTEREGGLVGGTSLNINNFLIGIACT